MAMMLSPSLLLLAFGSILSFSCTSAWVVPAARMMSRTTSGSSSTQQWMSETTSTELAPTAASDEGDDDDWEYVEFDSLTEADLVGSEWLVGTVWDSNPDKISETWCRLVTSERGENLAVWGDKKEGKWALDVATQYVTISKNYIWGKQIWAALVEDYYFLGGTVRGWTYISAACVEAQWQAKRLGVDPEEAGIAPWFEEKDESDEETSSEDAPAGSEMTASESTGAEEGSAEEEIPALAEEES